MNNKKEQAIYDKIKSIDDNIIKLRNQRLEISKQIDKNVNIKSNKKSLYDQLYDINIKISSLRDKKSKLYKELYTERGLDGSLVKNNRV